MSYRTSVLPEANSDDLRQIFLKLNVYVQNDILSYVFLNTNDLLKLLVSSSIFKDICSNIKSLTTPPWFTGKELQLFPNIEKLNCQQSKQLTDSDIQNCKNLLYLMCHTRLTDTAIINKTRLHTLECRGNKYISGYGLLTLTNLQSLEYDDGCPNITNNTIRQLTQLKELRTGKRITDIGIETLVNLEYFSCHHNAHITDYGIRKLQNLQTLHCYGCRQITYNSISQLRNLRELTIQRNKRISKEHLDELRSRGIRINIL